MTYKIAVVILNWNGRNLLEQFLPSVVAHSQEAKVYVADNASTDDSVNFINENFPTVQIIQNTINGGYAKGYNDALNQVDADIYCLLNSDVEVRENWLNPVIETFQKEENTAIIQPKILDYQKKDHFEYAGAAGGFIDKYGYAYCRGRIFDSIEKDTGQYNDSASIFWASGACMFIRSAVYRTLNGFDEAFFAHFEEIDLCWRAYNLGYETKYAGSSAIYHVGGATLKNTNPKKTYLNFRNSLYTITKNAPGPLFPLLFTRLILDGFAALKFLVEFKFFHIFAILKAHISFFGLLPALLKQRNGIHQKSLYFRKKSIVWAYYIAKRKIFNSL